MCLLAVLGSQGIVVKCTAAIFFRTVDFTESIVSDSHSNNTFPNIFAHHSHYARCGLCISFTAMLDIQSIELFKRRSYISSNEILHILGIESQIVGLFKRSKTLREAGIACKVHSLNI